MRIGKALGAARRFNRGGMVSDLCRGQINIDDAELDGVTKLSWRGYDSGADIYVTLLLLPGIT